METLSGKGKVSGLTLIELLVVIFMIVLLAVLLLPAIQSGPRPATSVICMNNQSQIVLGFFMWKSDHGDGFPWQISATNGGTMESSDRGYVAPNFQIIKDYLRQPRLFVCPTDEAKTVATNNAQLHDKNVSYFVGRDAGADNLASILTGDRHLQANGKPLKPGSFVYSTNAVLKWTRELHGQVQNGPIGGLSFADGHVQFTRNADLNSFFRNQRLASNRIVCP